MSSLSWFKRRGGGEGGGCKRAPAKCMGRGQKMVRAADKQSADKQNERSF